jgi:hypothetical protein
MPKFVIEREIPGAGKLAIASVNPSTTHGVDERATGRFSELCDSNTGRFFGSNCAAPDFTIARMIDNRGSDAENPGGVAGRILLGGG